MKRTLMLSAIGLILLAACSGSSGAPAASPSQSIGLRPSQSIGLIDAARVWCADEANAKKLGLSATTLWVDKGPAASINVSTRSDGVTTLNSAIAFWIMGDGYSASTDPLLRSVSQQVYAGYLSAWEEGSPETFARTCLVAFDARS
jgi:hypothetical protein